MMQAKVIAEPSLVVGRKYAWLIDDKPLIFITGKSQVVEIKKGFETDLASIPRFFHRIFPVNGNHRIPAIVHDYLYYEKGCIKGVEYTRKECDEIFLHLMRDYSVAEWRGCAMYRAVRVFGGMHWKKDTMQKQCGFCA